MKAIIPNTITALNLFCGCVAVINLLDSNFGIACFFVLLSLLLDFLDGFVARILNASSEIGKQLDSLADMVSFGMVPGVIMYLALVNAARPCLPTFFNTYLPYFGFILTVFSGIRLAKFNIDSRQSTSFIGLPTPANTLFFLIFPIIWKFYPENLFLNQLLENILLLVFLSLIFSYLLIAELPLFSLKFKNFTWRDNKEKFLFLFGTLALIFSFHFLAIPFIIILYLILSQIKKFL